jgi:hypothetical protein
MQDLRYLRHIVERALRDEPERLSVAARPDGAMGPCQERYRCAMRRARGSRRISALRGRARRSPQRPVPQRLHEAGCRRRRAVTWLG